MALPIGVAVVLAVLFVRRFSGKDERIEELEARVERLERDRSDPVDDANAATANEPQSTDNEPE